MHTPKPQIQGMEPRRGRLGARTLPYDCGVKRRIKGFWWCLDVFGREIRERRERIFPGNYPKSFFFFLQNEWSGGMYGLWHTSWGSAYLVCAESSRWPYKVRQVNSTNVSNFVSFFLIGSVFNCIFECLSGLRLSRSWCPWKYLVV